MNRLAALMVAILVGCGSVTDATDAGSDGDAAADGAVVGTATIVVLEGGEPVPDAAVFYHAATGEQVGDAIAGSDGRATIEDMPIGGYVTIARSLDSLELESVGGVRANDVITFDKIVISLLPPSGSAGTINITLPSDAADSYEVQSNCGRGTVPTGAPGANVMLDIRDTCPDTSNITVVVYGSTGGVRTKTQSAVSSVGSNLSFPSIEDVLTVEVQAPTSTVPVEATVRVSPLAATGIFDGHNEVTGLSSVAPTVVAARYKAGFVETIIAHVHFQPTTQPIGLSQLHVVDRKDGLSSEIGGQQVVDMTDRFPLLSSVSSGTEVESVAFEVAAPADCGRLGGADVTTVRLSATDSNAVQRHWQLATAGDVASPVAFPRLSSVPAELFWPRASFVSVRAVAQLTSLGDRSFDDFRTGPSANRFGLDPSFLDSGEVVCSSLAGDAP
jgi:hypothetical protein